MRLVRTVAATAVGVALLASCSNGETANETLPPASSSAETSEPLPPLGPTEFPVPAEARQRTPAGIAAFTAYYLDLADHLLSTLNSEPLRQFSQECNACNELADGYDADRAAGYRYEGGDISITSTGTALVEGSDAEISFLLHQNPVTVSDSQGAVVPERSSPALELSGGMSFRWDPSRQTWLVTQLTAERLE